MVDVCCLLSSSVKNRKIRWNSSFELRGANSPALSTSAIESHILITVPTKTNVADAITMTSRIAVT